MNAVAGLFTVPTFGFLGDAVVQKQSTRFQQALDRAEIGGEIAQADMFEHADAGDLVEQGIALQVAVIHEFHTDPVQQACGNRSRNRTRSRKTCGCRKFNVNPGAPVPNSSVLPSHRCTATLPG